MRCVAPRPTLSAQVTSYDPADQMETIQSGSEAAVVCRHDNKGNQLSGLPIQDSSYDFENRLVELIVDDGIIRKYTYNGLGDRIVREVGGQPYRDVLNYGTGLKKVLVEQNDEGNIQRYYLWGIGLIGHVDVNSESGDETILLYHSGELGNTLALTDESGWVIDTYAYTPYGEVSDHEGETDTPYLFNGGFGVRHEGDGIYHMKARYYSTRMKRFLSRDPLGLDGGHNLYTFAKANPVTFIDPFGLCPENYGGDVYDWGFDYRPNSGFQIQTSLPGTQYRPSNASPLYAYDPSDSYWNSDYSYRGGYSQSGYKHDGAYNSDLDRWQGNYIIKSMSEMAYPLGIDLSSKSSSSRSDPIQLACARMVSRDSITESYTEWRGREVDGYHRMFDPEFYLNSMDLAFREGLALPYGFIVDGLGGLSRFQGDPFSAHRDRGLKILAHVLDISQYPTRLEDELIKLMEMFAYSGTDKTIDDFLDRYAPLVKWVREESQNLVNRKTVGNRTSLLTPLDASFYKEIAAAIKADKTISVSIDPDWPLEDNNWKLLHISGAKSSRGAVAQLENYVPAYCIGNLPSHLLKDGVIYNQRFLYHADSQMMYYLGDTPVGNNISPDSIPSSMQPTPENIRQLNDWARDYGDQGAYAHQAIDANKKLEFFSLDRFEILPTKSKYPPTWGGFHKLRWELEKKWLRRQRGSK